MSEERLEQQIARRQVEQKKAMDAEQKREQEATGGLRVGAPNPPVPVAQDASEQSLKK